MVLPAFNQIKIRKFSFTTSSSAIKNLLVAATGTAFLALGIGETVQAATIDTASSWNGVNYIWPFGETNTATYGQTFTVPTINNVITSFTFFLDEYEGSDVAEFAAYLMKWDGTKATDSILYQSKAQSTDKVPGFQEFTFNTGKISLTPGTQYVAFLSASNFFDGENGTAKMGYIADIDDIYSDAGDVYSGGSYVFFNNGSDFSALTTNPWETFVGQGKGDTAFRASFQSSQPVPEPSTLGSTAVAVLLGIWFKRKQLAIETLFK